MSNIVWQCSTAEQYGTTRPHCSSAHQDIVTCSTAVGIQIKHKVLALYSNPSTFKACSCPCESCKSCKPDRLEKRTVVVRSTDHPHITLHRAAGLRTTAQYSLPSFVYPSQFSQFLLLDLVNTDKLLICFPAKQFCRGAN